ncbi:DinB family protein [Bacillus sp. CLL-7-23]|uniref:DinB family protein n=1 Tax=Bacillus changyiensis TaxID=3004103 RepID=A0ABT4X7X7_9BACI|nr:DinB family protein [Bacillus changyiensis]MDA7028343.1 DinB family protein [Bacillus changyiensis]
MNFQLEEAIEILERTPKTLQHLLDGLSNSWITCNEGEATWNAFDIVGHLIEGEKQNWIPRIEMIITKGETETFPPFDRFTQIQQNAEKTIEQLLDEFAKLRQDNLEKLQCLVDSQTNLEQTGIHPEFGVVKLREQISTWVAHDLDHLSQMTRVLAKRYQEDVGPWKGYLRILKQ